MKFRKSAVIFVVGAALLVSCAEDRPDVAGSDSRTKNGTLSLDITALKKKIADGLAAFFGPASTTTTSPTTTTPKTTTTAPKTPTTTAATTTTAAKTTTTVGATTTTVAPPGPCTTSRCRIGDTGPNGGTVFITPSTPGNSSGWYFETVAGSFGREYSFGCGSTPIAATGDAIGDGPANTAKILFLCGTSTPFGKLSRTAVDDPSKPWFLPSSGELLQLLKNASILQGSAGSRYGQFWSSTVASESSVYVATVDRTSVGLRSRSDSYDFGLVAAFKPDLTNVVITNKPRTYAIGDRGPAGGRVFITPETKGNATGKYFEVAPNDWSGTPISPSNLVFDPQVGWACNEYQEKSVSGTQTEIGTGRANTKLINDACASTAFPYRYATAEAVKYRGGGRTDWFVPSKEELKQMYLNIDKAAPGLTTTSDRGSGWVKCAWSSSEINETVGWGGNQNLPPWGSEMFASKKQLTTNCVMPVRMFDATEVFGTKAQ